MLKTIFELCEPRQETLTGGTIDDVQELDMLLDKRIDPNDFFSKNYVTNNMRLLFNKTFARFSGRSDGSGLIVLKQAMGGGKTHNMIALGLLAQYPSIRKQILGADFPYLYEGEIEVVGFTGRNSPELPWIEIARRLNRLNLFRQSVSPDPNNLMKFLLEISPKTKTMILATATPIQLHPVEGWDLLYILAKGSERILGSEISQWRLRHLDGIAYSCGEKESPRGSE
ncbi:MAG TPA: hypothetical protein VIL26_08555, partial [Clostridia bacterium]